MKAKEFSSIVVLTGAGISAESGFKTFRDNNGLWEDHRVEDVATPEAFQRNPELVHRFYNLRRKQLCESANPNAAHIALGEFEKKYKGDYLLVTQNVDNLHELGGSQSLIHMHGELFKARCLKCSEIMKWTKDMSVDTPCPSCQNTHCLRPHIVWFGEIPLEMECIEQALLACDLFVSIGTSGNVYPAAGFVQLARSINAHCVELNLEASEGRFHFNEFHCGPAT